MTLAQLIAALQALDVPGETEVVVDSGEPRRDLVLSGVSSVNCMPAWMNEDGEIVITPHRTSLGMRVVVWRN